MTLRRLLWDLLAVIAYHCAPLSPQETDQHAAITYFRSSRPRRP